MVSEAGSSGEAEGQVTVKRHDSNQNLRHEQRPLLPYCQPIILVLAFWPRICECTGAQPVD
jgi:hypothetical protein